MPTTGSYPRFSDAEMARRRGVLAALADEAGVAELLLYGADRTGAAVQWAIQWPVTREAVVLWSGGNPVLFVQFANHLDNARALAQADVRWGGLVTFETVAAELRARHPSGVGRLGILGPLPASALGALTAVGAEPVYLERAFQRARYVKSAEELAWTRRAAAFTDDAVTALASGAAVGMAEAELGALVEQAYVGRGATNHIHYFAVTAMERPSVRVPAQWPSDRRLRAGDVVVCEISANWWGYTGQVLRTFTVAAPPTPRYAELHAAATAAFEAVLGRVRAGTTGRELADAARVVEEAGFSTCDDVVHGYVGGYFPPIVPGEGRPGRHDDFVLEAGMTIVVQPNVVTREGNAGVQTGELVLVTDTGHEPLHRFPRGLGRIGGPA